MFSSTLTPEHSHPIRVVTARLCLRSCARGRTVAVRMPIEVVMLRIVLLTLRRSQPGAGARQEERRRAWPWAERVSPRRVVRHGRGPCSGGAAPGQSLCSPGLSECWAYQAPASPPLAIRPHHPGRPAPGPDRFAPASQPGRPAPARADLPPGHLRLRPCRCRLIQRHPRQETTDTLAEVVDAILEASIRLQHHWPPSSPAVLIVEADGDQDLTGRAMVGFHASLVLFVVRPDAVTPFPQRRPRECPT